MIFTCCSKTLPVVEKLITPHITLCRKRQFFPWSSLNICQTPNIRNSCYEKFDSYVSPILTTVRHAHKIRKQQSRKIQDLDVNGQTVLNWASRNVVAYSELNSNRFRWWAFLKKKLDIRVPWKVGNCFSNSETISVSRPLCSRKLDAWKLGV